MTADILGRLGSDDVGTRLQHTMDLQEAWSTALGLLTTPGFHSEYEKSRAEKLESALALLQNYMEIGYSSTAYAKAINDLPMEPMKSCPRCGSIETITEAIPRGRFWVACKRCHLDTDVWDKFTTT